MSQLGTFDRLANEGEKGTRRRRFLWGSIALFLTAIAVDYVLYWPQSSRIQRDIESRLNSYPLPSDTTQVDFGHGHQPHHGWATRVLASAKSPQQICDFYVPKLVSEGWHLTEVDCGIDESLSDTNRGLYLLKFENGRETIRLRYFGREAGKHVYRFSLSW